MTEADDYYWVMSKSGPPERVSRSLRLCEIAGLSGFSSEHEACQAVNFRDFKASQRKLCLSAGCTRKMGFCGSNLHFPPANSELLFSWNTRKSSGDLLSDWRSVQEGK